VSAVVQVVSLRIEDGVKAVYMTLNPDKLSRWSVAEVEQERRPTILRIFNALIAHPLSPQKGVP
jgi:hypothetical protein